jgi:4-hydroxy-2-oxoheptanedioate aldolase
MRDLLRKNPLKTAISEKKAVFGIYIEEPSSTIVELAGVSGFHFVRLDWCHAPLDLQALAHQILAAEYRNVTPVVRLECDEQKIGQVLEMGAMGIVVPDVSNAAEAKRVVDAARFSPQGRRGLFSASRKASFGSVEAGAFTKWSNEEILVGIQIESLEAMENIEEILSVEGIDIVLSGRGDLSNALGVPGEKTHPLVLDAEKKIFGNALAKGLAVSPQLDPYAADFQDDLKKWIERGAYVISLGIDHAIIRKAFEGIVKKAVIAS